MKAVVGTMSFLLGTSVFLIGMWDGHEASGEAVAYLSALAVCVGWLVYVTTMRRLLPALIVVVVFGLAYAPGASEAMTRGILDGQIPASAEGARTAIAALVLFLLSVIGLVVWWASGRLATRAADRVVRLVSAGSDRAFSFGLAGAFVVTLVAAFRSGFWSHYGGYARDMQSGGLRLELLYGQMLLSAFVVLGRHLGRAVWRVPFSIRSVLIPILPWLALLALLFINQSRRLMVVALIITAIDPLLLMLMHRPRRAVPLTRIAAVSAAGLALVIALFVGSALWRASFKSSSGVAANWDAQLQYTMDNMAADRLEAEFTAAKATARFTYLWIDAASIEQVDVVGTPDDLGDVLSASVANATPEILLPDKYKSPPIRCESAFALVGVAFDLACTPISEAVLFGHGNILGFTLVIALFALGLTIASLAHRQGSDAGLVLSCLMLTPFSNIETGAFPIVLALRGLLISGAFLALAAWLLRNVVSGGDQTHVETLADAA